VFKAFAEGRVTRHLHWDIYRESKFSTIAGSNDKRLEFALEWLWP
jgi:hypothetical protein